MNTNRIILEIKTYMNVARSHLFTVNFVIIFLFSLTIGIVFSSILGIILVISYFGGAYTSYVLYPQLPSFLQPKEVTRPVVSVGCTVCGDHNCRRQKPTGEHQPWVGLDVPRDIDQALQDLFNKILNEFVVSWYGKITRDESFIWQIRERLRYACSILLRRILRTDAGEVICERLFPIFLGHVDDFVSASDGCESAADKVATVVSHLSERLHPAARSRHSELEYLKAVSWTLAGIGLYPQELQCRPVSILLVDLLAGWLLLTLSDTLCSPYIINTLLWLAVDSEKLQPFPEPPAQKVQFLKTFAMRPSCSLRSPLHKDLCTILKQQNLLYPLMQYLKRCGVVHLLQFCLDIEDFNRRLLVPEMSASNSKELLKEAWELYDVYLKPSSPDAIPCSPSVGEQLHQGINLPPDLLFSLLLIFGIVGVLVRGGNDVTRLQTSPPLFQAYEEIFCLLEQMYLPGFYQSDLYFNTLCARRDPVHKVKLPQKKSEPLVSKLSQKLQRLVSSQVDSSGLLVEAACDATELDCGDVLDIGSDFAFRDMSGWKVQIPIALNEQDSNSRPYPSFIIRVAADQGEETWEVKRKFNDFYTLQSKLLEFHQKLVEELPPKKGLFSPRGAEYLESRRQLLEGYLQRLVRQPELRYSDLLHCFLRSPAEFQIALRNPSSLYGMLRRSVDPIKLRKERGRHLESFLNTLLASIETPVKSELLYNEHEALTMKRDITQTLFGDNLAEILARTASWPPPPVRPTLRLASFWDCILYILWRLFGCRSWLQRVVLVVKSGLGEAGAPAVHSYINNRIQSLLLPRLPHLIRLLQSAILSPSVIHDEQETAKLAADVTEALTQPSRTCMAWVLQLIVPRWQEGVTTLVHTLQHPTLNKHLFYCLFDELLKSLFTEFSVPAKP